MRMLPLGMDAFDGSTLDSDVILHGTSWFTSGSSQAGLVYVANAMTVYSSVMDITAVYNPTAQVWGPGSLNVEHLGAVLNDTSGGLWADCLTVATITLDTVAIGWHPPASGTFVLNGTSQVNVSGTNGVNAFSATAPITLSLKTVGGTPGATAPYFSQAQAANNFYVKSGTASADDTYNWTAQPSPVTLSAANLDIYLGLFNPQSGTRFAST